MSQITIASKLEKLQKVQQIIDVKAQTLLTKALHSDNPTDIIKAQTILNNIESKGDSNRKSYLLDPLEFNSSFGYKDKPISMSYGMLRSMAKTPIVNAIIRTRINQIAAFTEPQRDKYSIGYVIRKKQIGKNSDDKKLTKQEEKEIEKLYMFMENCGESDVWGADDFDGFTRKIMRDSLTYDQMTFEIERNRRGVPVAFYATDSSTFRVADSYDDDNYALNKEKQFTNRKAVKGYYPSYVQIYQMNVINEFYPWELCFGVRNPVSWVENNGYGVSELEEMIGVITSMLWGDEYNRRFFKQGSVPKGLLKVSGNIPEHKLAEFKQQWNATMRGVYNAWKTPILEAEKVDWVNLQTNNRDMEYSQWMEFQIKIASAIFTIDPAEINFALSGSTGEKPLFEKNNEASLKHSKDKGLYPLLKFYQKRLNKFILQPLTDGKYELIFAGLDSMTPQDELDMDIKAISNFETINEVRSRRGLDEIEGGDIIMNPTYTSNMQQQAMAEQQDQAGQGGYGEENPEENPFVKSFEDWAINDLNKN